MAVLPAWPWDLAAFKSAPFQRLPVGDLGPGLAGTGLLSSPWLLVPAV